MKKQQQQAGFTSPFVGQFRRPASNHENKDPKQTTLTKRLHSDAFPSEAEFAQGYWTRRNAKLKEQLPQDYGIYQKISGLLGCPKEVQQGGTIFKGCSFYFNGRMDACINAQIGSQYHLTKLAAYHGADIRYMISKKQVTHVICTNLSARKKEQELKQCTLKKIHLWYVSPTWIEQCIAQGKRLPEAQFSIL